MWSRIFDFEFEVSSSWKVIRQQCDSTLECWCLDSYISIFWSDFVSDNWRLFPEGFELWAIEKVICLRFGLEENDDRPSFFVLLGQIGNDLWIEIERIAFSEWNFPVTFWINRRLDVPFFNLEVLNQNIFLWFCHCFQRTCHSQNTLEISWQFCIRKTCNHKFNADLLRQFIGRNWVVDKMLMIVSPNSPIPIMDLIGKTVPLLIIYFAIHNWVNILGIIFDVSNHGVDLILNNLLENLMP